MFVTNIGAFNGKSWEDLCQLAFKKKYFADGYQEMVASPGDFGIEGFTLLTGLAFQCYCPDKHYSRPELYDAQRDKITDDLKKLQKFESQIASRIGGLKIKSWIFVTPELDRNALLVHARKKELEVRSWALPILAPDFNILLHDLDHYLIEFNEVRSAQGKALFFEESAAALPPLDGSSEEYERNIVRKSEKRMESLAGTPGYDKKLRLLQDRTLRTFLEGDSYFRRVEEQAPAVYYRVVRLVSEYENHVVEMASTWSDTPDALTNYVRDKLETRLCADLSPELDSTTASQVARHMVARWLAICELDYE